MTALEELTRTILLCRDYVADDLSDEHICSGFQSVKVLCVSDLRNLSSHSGQTALITLVSLLGRMGIPVWLHIPEIAMVLPQPPLSGSYVRAALIASSEILVAGATVRADSNLNPDLTFVLGDTKIDSGHGSWRLGGSDWYGALAMEHSAKVQAWTVEWPVGAMVSAALAANEAFKFVVRQMPLRNRADQVFFEPSRFSDWNFGLVPIPTEEIRLGEVDVVSAGAICQAALYALLRLPKVQMWGRIFDDDLTGASNLNRNMLTTVTDIGSKKVQLVAERCGPKLRLEPIPNRFAGMASELGKLAPRVIVGVDDIPSRWQAQRDASGWLAVSGTSHFSISSSDHRPCEPCSGCLHPVDDPGAANPIPTVSFVSFWAGLAMSVRLLREALGSAYASNRQHLWLTPLRMDLPYAAMWMPIAARQDCPVTCSASRKAQRHTIGAGQGVLHSVERSKNVVSNPENDS